MRAACRLREISQRWRWRAIVAGIALTLCDAGRGADERGIAFFESAIRPLLVEHCYECHSAEAAQNDNLQSGLQLDTRQGMLTGGEAGPALLPGDPENSLLLSALTREVDPMPPTGRLPDEVIDRFAKWIAMGAPDPRDSGASAPTPRRAAFAITDADRAHWSFRPVQNVRPPVVRDAQWPRDPLDRFVLAPLEAENATPSPEADRHSLLRRTTYALTGLPPTPAEIRAFVADDRPEAIVDVVDRLLATPEYGAHWGRHWLDGVRYADNVDQTATYRDWVIRAFNSDLPYDEFLRLQIAGDLFPAAGVPPEQVHANGASFDGIAATGMLSLAVWEIVGRDLAVAEIVDSQIDVVGRQVLGLTLSCARCHDHKFDPISIEDYYGLAGIFFSSHIATGKLVADGRLANELIEVTLLSADKSAQQDIDVQIAELEAQIASQEQQFPQATKLKTLDVRIAAPDEHFEPPEVIVNGQSVPQKRQALMAEREELLADQQKNGWAADPPELAGFAEARRTTDALKHRKKQTIRAVAIREGGVPGSNREQIGDAPVYLRGEYQHPGPVIPRRFPTILAGENQTPIGDRTSQSGRRELAEWITAPDHPLTARVMVNRVWQQIIGHGLVRTPDNFGRLGEPPTHPELLDHLAQRFVASGWSIKRLVRDIVLSATFQQTSLVVPAVAAADPDNRRLGRMNRRRLTYEELRDTLHLIGGQLARVDDDTQPRIDGAAELRTVYEPVDRRTTNATAAMFDGADPKTIVSQRAETTTAPQALYLMNSPLAAETAERLASRLVSDPSFPSEDDRLEELWLTVFGRPAAADELDEARSFVGRYSLAGLVHVLLAANEMVYVD